MSEQPTTKNLDAIALGRRGGKNRLGTKNKPKLPVDVAHKLGWDPIEWMIHIARNGTVLETDGRETVVDMAERLKMGREVTVYLRSKAPVEVHSEHEHLHAHVDVTHIMSNPALAQAAETLALAMAEQDNTFDAEFSELPADE